MRTSRSKPQHQALALVALTHGYTGVRELATKARVSPRALYYALARPSGRRQVLAKLAAKLDLDPEELRLTLFGGGA